MSKEQIVQAWKDETFRRSLSKGQRAQLPENPAGFINLDDVELDSVVAGWMRPTFTRVCTDLVAL